jgi:RHS repeat-associated protein
MKTHLRDRLGRLLSLAVAWIVLASSGFARADIITYYYNDLLGSPRVAYQGSTQVMAQQNYYPYGERINPTVGVNKIWYTSRHQDDDTGLVYMGARSYDPLTARFLSVDPKGFDGGGVHSFNRYVYASNNPYRYLDPNGREPVDLINYLRLLIDPYRSAYGQAGADAGQLARTGDAVQRDMKTVGDAATDIAVAAAMVVGPESVVAIRAAPYILSAVSFATRAEARAALVGDVGAAANRFFRGSKAAKSENFLVESLSDGSRRLQFFDPAKSEGYGKLYVQEINADGQVLREYKDTLGPQGLVERKWLHGGPE